MRFVTRFMTIAAVGLLAAGTVAAGDVAVSATAPDRAPGKGGDHCGLPGQLVVQDLSGDATTSPAVEAHDVEAVYFAEPAQPDGAEKLYITLKVGSLDPVPTPNTIYYVQFVLSDGIKWFVSFRPYVAPGQSQFNYGRNEPPTTPGTSGTLATIGPTGPESHFTVDGHITWVVPKGLIEPLASTPDVGPISGEARALIGTPVPLGVPGLVMIVDDGGGGFYTQQGNDSCKGAKSGFLGVGGVAPGLLLFLALAGLARRRF